MNVPQKSGQYGRTLKTIEDSDAFITLKKVLKSRKSPNTRRYVYLILLHLSYKKLSDPADGSWILSTDMRKELVCPDKIPNTSTFYNLMKDLEKVSLVEKRTCNPQSARRGAGPAYYRVRVVFDPMWFLDPEEFVKVTKMFETIRRRMIGDLHDYTHMFSPLKAGAPLTSGLKQLKQVNSPLTSGLKQLKQVNSPLTSGLKQLKQVNSPLTSGLKQLKQVNTQLTSDLEQLEQTTRRFKDIWGDTTRYVNNEAFQNWRPITVGPWNLNGK